MARSFLFNQEGKIYRAWPLNGERSPAHRRPAPRTLQQRPRHFARRPDHRDQRYVADRKVDAFISLPIAGGAPRQITPTGPSYWHGWSPDGKTLAFTGQRGDNFDIYTIPAAGGEEKRLTTAKGLDDGPEYSPDGAWIYFNSERTGHMQIWRMQADGSDQEQVLRVHQRLVSAHFP